jgi:O-antigen ligase
LRAPPSLSQWWLLPPAVFLFILPFAHTIALRWIAAALTLGIAIWQWRRGPRVPPLPCKAAFAFWAGSLLLSLLWATNPAESASRLKVDVGYSLAMFLAFYGLTQSVRELQFWLLALAKGSLAISLLAIAYCAWFGEWRFGYQNARGEFATCMITVAPTIMLLASPAMPWTRATAHVRWILPVMLVAGLLTLSRMFLGALVLMMLVAAGLEAARGRINLRQSLIVAGIALALAAVAVLFVTEERGINLGGDLRPAIWKFAWQRIMEHPWTGTGYGFLINRHDFELAFPDRGIFHPHNLLLAYAEQAGILGALAIVVMFVALGREYWRLYRADALAASYVGIAGLAMLIGVFTKNMTDMFFANECALLFWSLNGILLGYGRRAAAPAKAEER